MNQRPKRSFQRAVLTQPPMSLIVHLRYWFRAASVAIPREKVTDAFV